MKNDDFLDILNKIKELEIKVKSKVKELLEIDIYKERNYRKLDVIRNELSSYQSEIDRILKIDFYHLIGMTNLSGSQIMKIVKSIKTLGRAEDTLKRGISIINGAKIIIGSITSESTYKCSSLLNEVFKQKSTLTEFIN